MVHGHFELFHRGVNSILLTVIYSHTTYLDNVGSLWKKLQSAPTFAEEEPFYLHENYRF